MKMFGVRCSLFGAGASMPGVGPIAGPTPNTERGSAELAEVRTPNTKAGFTLIELMVAIGILLIMGVIIIGFLRGALDVSRKGTARGEAYGTAQTVLRDMGRDLAQVLPGPAHPDGALEDPAFIVMHDPFGRQILAFTRAWGEEQRSVAGYDAGRGAPSQGYRQDFTGRNVNDAMRPSHGNIEVVYLMEPTPDGTRLYRAERSPPDAANGLISAVAAWCVEYAGRDPLAAQAAILNTPIGGEPLWNQFELLAENVVAFGFECWDDWERTRTWYSGPDGPVTEWSMFQRFQQGRYLLPRALRVTLIIGAPDPLGAQTVLSGDLPSTDTSLYVESTGGFNDALSGAAFIRVNGELIAYGSRSTRLFGSCARGVLGTQPADHAAGSTVLGGEVFRRVIQLPVAR